MDLPAPLASLVVKDGLGIGLLGQRERELVLALAARAIEAGRDHSEADVNDRLEAWLARTGSMLRSDRVELRRWLVDAGFVVRDGFGRVYRRDDAQTARSTATLGDHPRGTIESAIDALRAARSAAREARRRAFDASREGPPAAAQA